MRRTLGSLSTLAWSVVLALSIVYPANAAPEHLRYYKTGLTSAESGQWSQVEAMMRRAIAIDSEEKRLLVRRGTYFPHYYLGLARYHQKDCAGALAAWAVSEDQGVIVGRDEFAKLLRLRADCQNNGAPSLAQKASPPPKPGSEPEAEPEKEKKTTKERFRDGQLVVEKGADPARKGLTAVERVAPEDSKLGRAAGKGQAAVDAAETASEVVDIVLSPKQQLEAAINAYFAGNPQRALEKLRGIDLSDPREACQVYLFRAAAYFRLHRLAGHHEAHLAAARKNAALFQKSKWRGDFPDDLFDPSFVRLVRGGG